MSISDTSTTVKLRWEVRTVSVYEADVPVDQLPDALLWEDGDEWGIQEGDVDHYSVSDFLDALDGAGSAMEQSLSVEGYTILDAASVPPVQVAAPPEPAIIEPPVSAERMAEFAEEATAVTGITECERTGEHQSKSDHRWQECPVYHDNGSIE